MAEMTTTETQLAASVTPSYRRNGKLFSCEPCRRGKLRCDHNSPVCGRCERRNKANQCVYHPAPLTKPRSSEHPRRQSLQPANASASSQLTASRPQHNGLISPSSSSAADSVSQDFSAIRAGHNASLGHMPILPPAGQAIPTQPHVFGDTQGNSAALFASPESAAMSFRDSKTGFLGPTSYNAVFTENPGSLSAILDPVDDREVPHPPPVSSEKIQQGAEVLSMFRDMAIYRRFTQRWFNLCDGAVVMQPVFRIWMDDLWTEFGPILQESRPEQLRNLSELVWRNTRRPLKTHGQMTALEWAKSATGRHLRWEVVGAILSQVGLIACNLSNWDTLFDTIRELDFEGSIRDENRVEFAERMRKAAEYCLCFCYESEVLNEIYVCFMYEDLILVECLKGDAHYAAWQRTGEVCDAIIALGLHQGNPVDAETPFWMSQMRKKIFTSAYGRDKVVATFLGRPPRLSHRYCKMEYPLDLSDEELVLEGPELDAVLSRLDANGWNTDGRFNRTTWMRVWFQHCAIRENILEIALGSGDEDISLKAEQIRLKLQNLHDSYPDFARVPPEEMLNRSDTYVNAAYGSGGTDRSGKALRQVNATFALCIHAGIVHTEFLLQRALINRKHTDTKELIPISKRLLSLVLLSQSKRDLFRDFQGDLTYLMFVHGLPAAGVLSIELLKQEQSRAYTSDILPRSETIQDLSVFISALASVEPGEGNFAVCNQGRKALKRVLDQILSPNSGAHPTTGSADQAFDDMSLYFPTGNDADFLQWLENVEWDKGGFLNTGAG